MFTLERQINRLNEAKEKAQGDNGDGGSAYASSQDTSILSPTFVPRLGQNTFGEGDRVSKVGNGIFDQQKASLGIQSFLYNYLKTAGETGNFSQFNFSGQIDFSARYNSGSAQAHFKTSLGQVLNWQRKNKEQINTGLGLLKNGSASAFMPLDIWMEGVYSGISGDRSGHFSMLSAGVDYVFNPNFIGGFYVQLDSMERKSDFNLCSTGWMAGPYATVRLGDDIFWQIRGGWGQSSNKIYSSIGDQSDFGSMRWMVSSSLSGIWTDGVFRFAPTASLSYFEEKSNEYRDQFGVPIPSAKLALGQLRLSPEFGFIYETDNGFIIEPSLTLEWIWNFSNIGLSNQVELNDESIGATGIRGRVKAHVMFKAPTGASFGISGSYDGIGSKRASIAGQATIHVPSN